MHIMPSLLLQNNRQFIVCPSFSRPCFSRQNSRHLILCPCFFTSEQWEFHIMPLFFTAEQRTFHIMPLFSRRNSRHLILCPCFSRQNNGYFILCPVFHVETAGISYYVPVFTAENRVVLPNVQTEYGGQQTSYFIGAEGIFPGVKRQGRDTVNSFISSAEFKNMLSYISIAPYSFMTCTA
jgi:hypothetical protein